MYSERGFIRIGGKEKGLFWQVAVEKEISGNGCVKFFNMYRSCRTGLGRFAEVRAHRWGDSQTQHSCLLQKRRARDLLFISGQLVVLRVYTCPQKQPAVQLCFATQNSIEFGFATTKPDEPYTALKTAVFSYDIQRFLDSGSPPGGILAVSL